VKGTPLGGAFSYRPLYGVPPEVHGCTWAPDNGCIPDDLLYEAPEVPRQLTG